MNKIWITSYHRKLLNTPLEHYEAQSLWRLLKQHPQVYSIHQLSHIRHIPLLPVGYYVKDETNQLVLFIRAYQEKNKIYLYWTTITNPLNVYHTYNLSFQVQNVILSVKPITVEPFIKGKIKHNFIFLSSDLPPEGCYQFKLTAYNDSTSNRR